MRFIPLSISEKYLNYITEIYERITHELGNTNSNQMMSCLLSNVGLPHCLVGQGKVYLPLVPFNFFFLNLEVSGMLQYRFKTD